MGSEFLDFSRSLQTPATPTYSGGAPALGGQKEEDSWLTSAAKFGVRAVDFLPTVTGLRAALDPDADYGETFWRWAAQDWEKEALTGGSTGERLAMSHAKAREQGRSWSPIQFLPDVIQEPVEDFVIQLAGDLVEDPAAWVSLGGSAALKIGAKKLGKEGIKRALKSGSKSRALQTAIEVINAKEKIEGGIGLGLMAYGGSDALRGAYELAEQGNIEEATKMGVRALLLGGLGGYMAKGQFKGRGAAPQEGVVLDKDNLSSLEQEMQTALGMEGGPVPRDETGRPLTEGPDVYEIDATQPIYERGELAAATYPSPEDAVIAPITPEERYAVMDGMREAVDKINKIFQEDAGDFFQRPGERVAPIELMFMDRQRAEAEGFNYDAIPTFAARRTTDGANLIFVKVDAPELNSLYVGDVKKNVLEAMAHEAAHFLPGNVLEPSYWAKKTPIQGEFAGAEGAVMPSGHGQGPADPTITDITHIAGRERIMEKIGGEAFGEVLKKVQKRKDPWSGTLSWEAPSYKPETAQLAADLGVGGRTRPYIEDLGEQTISLEDLVAGAKGLPVAQRQPTLDEVTVAETVKQKLAGEWKDLPPQEKLDAANNYIAQAGQQFQIDKAIVRRLILAKTTRKGSQAAAGKAAAGEALGAVRESRPPPKGIASALSVEVTPAPKPKAKQEVVPLKESTPPPKGVGIRTLSEPEQKWNEAVNHILTVERRGGADGRTFDADLDALEALADLRVKTGSMEKMFDAIGQLGTYSPQELQTALRRMHAAFRDAADQGRLTEVKGGSQYGKGQYDRFLKLWKKLTGARGGILGRSPRRRRMIQELSEKLGIPREEAAKKVATSVEKTSPLWKNVRKTVTQTRLDSLKVNETDLKRVITREGPEAAETLYRTALDNFLEREAEVKRVMQEFEENGRPGMAGVVQRRLAAVRREIEALKNAWTKSKTWGEKEAARKQEAAQAVEVDTTPRETPPVAKEVEKIIPGTGTRLKRTGGRLRAIMDEIAGGGDVAEARGVDPFSRKKSGEIKTFRAEEKVYWNRRGEPGKKKKATVLRIPKLKGEDAESRARRAGQALLRARAKDARRRLEMSRREGLTTEEKRQYNPTKTSLYTEVTPEGMEVLKVTKREKRARQKLERERRLRRAWVRGPKEPTTPKKSPDVGRTSEEQIKIEEATEKLTTGALVNRIERARRKLAKLPNRILPSPRRLRELANAVTDYLDSVGVPELGSRFDALFKSWKDLDERAPLPEKGTPIGRDINRRWRDIVMEEPTTVPPPTKGVKRRAGFSIRIEATEKFKAFLEQMRRIHDLTVGDVEGKGWKAELDERTRNTKGTETFMSEAGAVLDAALSKGNVTKFPTRAAYARAVKEGKIGIHTPNVLEQLFDIPAGRNVLETIEERGANADGYMIVTERDAFMKKHEQTLVRESVEKNMLAEYEALEKASEAAKKDIAAETLQAELDKLIRMRDPDAAARIKDPRARREHLERAFYFAGIDPPPKGASLTEVLDFYLGPNKVGSTDVGVLDAQLKRLKEGGKRGKREKTIAKPALGDVATRQMRGPAELKVERQGTWGTTGRAQTKNFIKINLNKMRPFQGKPLPEIKFYYSGKDWMDDPQSLYSLWHAMKNADPRIDAMFDTRVDPNATPTVEVFDSMMADLEKVLGKGGLEMITRQGQIRRPGAKEVTDITVTDVGTEVVAGRVAGTETRSALQADSQFPVAEKEGEEFSSLDTSSLIRRAMSRDIMASKNAALKELRDAGYMLEGLRGEELEGVKGGLGKGAKIAPGQRPSPVKGRPGGRKGPMKLGVLKKGDVEVADIISFPEGGYLSQREVAFMKDSMGKHLAKWGKSGAIPFKLFTKLKDGTMSPIKKNFDALDALVAREMELKDELEKRLAAGEDIPQSVMRNLTERLDTLKEAYKEAYELRDIYAMYNASGGPLRRKVEAVDKATGVRVGPGRGKVGLAVSEPSMHKQLVAFGKKNLDEVQTPFVKSGREFDVAESGTGLSMGAILDQIKTRSQFNDFMRLYNEVVYERTWDLTAEGEGVGKRPTDPAGAREWDAQFRDNKALRTQWLKRHPELRGTPKDLGDRLAARGYKMLKGSAEVRRVRADAAVARAKRAAAVAAESPRLSREQTAIVKDLSRRLKLSHDERMKARKIDSAHARALVEDELYELAATREARARIEREKKIQRQLDEAFGKGKELLEDAKAAAEKAKARLEGLTDKEVARRERIKETKATRQAEKEARETLVDAFAEAAEDGWSETTSARQRDIEDEGWAEATPTGRRVKPMSKAQQETLQKGGFGEELEVMRTKDPRNLRGVVGGGTLGAFRVLADEALSLGKLSRTALSMGDVSPFFRQNLIHTLAHPKQAVQEIRGALSLLRDDGKFLGDKAAEARFERLMTNLTSSPTYALGRLVGLNHPEFGKNVEFSAQDLLTQWDKKGKYNPKKWVSQVFGPLSRRSEWIFAYGQAEAMQRTFDNLLAVGYAEGALGPGVKLEDKLAYLQDIAAFANTVTGRSPISNKTVKKVAENIAFSPGLLKSRVEALADVFTAGSRYKHATAKKAIRTEYLRAGAGLGGLMFLAWGALKAMGEEPEVEWDPRSSDFMKIRAGNIRIDAMGGFQQFIRFGAQMSGFQPEGGKFGGAGASATWNPITSGAVRKETTTGKLKTVSRWEVFEGFVRSKLAPTPGYLVDWMKGANMVGEKPTGPGLVKQHLVPLAWQDVMEIRKEAGDGMALLLAPALFLGVGMQTYGTGGDWRYGSEPVKKKTRMVYEELRDLGLRGPRPGRTVGTGKRDEYGRKTRYRLTDKQYEELEDALMPEIMNQLADFMKSDEYKRMPEAIKRKVLYQKIRRMNKRYSAAKTGGRKYIPEAS